MNDNKVEDILLELLREVAYIKAKIDNIDAQNLNLRIDAVEGQNREHDKTIKSLECRNSSVEEYLRNTLIESKKQNLSTWIGVGMAIFGSLLSVSINLF